MAENYGFRLLRDIREESLSDLLSAVRTSAPFAGLTGVAILDEIFSTTQSIIAPTLPQDEDQEAFPSSPGLLPLDYGPETLDSGSHAASRFVPPMVEVKAAGSAEGKMQMLYSIVGELLLDHKLGLVVWIDCSGRIDILRLYTVMLGMMGETAHKPDYSDVEMDFESSVSVALDRLHIFSPASSALLLSTVRGLQAYLFGLQDRPAGDLPVKAVIISGTGAFYWEDRWKEEEDKSHINLEEKIIAINAGDETQAVGTTRKAKRAFSMLSHHAMLVLALSNFQSTFSCPIFLSSTSFRPLKFSAPIPDSNGENQPRQSWPLLRSPLPSPWAKHVNVEVVLTKDKLSKYAHGISIDEALGQRAFMQGGKKASPSRMQVWIDPSCWLQACFPGQLAANGSISGRRKYSMLVSSERIEIRRDDAQVA